MKSILLKADPREVTGKKVKKLRQGGLLPVGVYGKDVKSLSLAVDLKEFLKVYHQAGETGLVELQFADKKLPTLIADVQFHPLTRLPLHVQFHAVNLTEKIKANVPVELIGESPAVQNKIGLLLQALAEVEVEALPTDLPEKISLEVSSLTEIDQQFAVKDLTAPKGVEILTEKEEVIVKVVPAVSAEAKKEAEEEAAKKAAAATTAATPAEGAPTPAAETPVKEEAKTEEKKKE